MNFLTERFMKNEIPRTTIVIINIFFNFLFNGNVFVFIMFIGNSLNFFKGFLLGSCYNYFLFKRQA